MRPRSPDLRGRHRERLVPVATRWSHEFRLSDRSGGLLRSDAAITPRKMR